MIDKCTRIRLEAIGMTREEIQGWARSNKPLSQNTLQKYAIQWDPIRDAPEIHKTGGKFSWNGPRGVIHGTVEKLGAGCRRGQIVVRDETGNRRWEKITNFLAYARKEG